MKYSAHIVSVILLMVLIGVAFWVYQSLPQAADNTVATDQTNEAKTYKNRLFNYSFDYPQGYYLDLTFAENNYSVRGEEGEMVGGDIYVSSYPFPTDSGNTTAAACRQDADYLNIWIAVHQVPLTTTIDEDLTAMKLFDYNDSVVSKADFKGANTTGRVYTYKPVSYSDLPEELKGDLPMTKTEFEMCEAINGPHYFFKRGDKLVVFNSVGNNRRGVERIADTFRFL